MSYTITCYTLFDITQTGVLNRNKPLIDMDNEDWLLQRNTQCNLDTVLQVISLRSQPENISKPIKISIRFDEFDNFGFLYKQMEDESYPCWKFDFIVQHPSVFSDGISELGLLYRDCDRIPMISGCREWNRLPNFLDGSDELRNIYFELRE